MTFTEVKKDLFTLPTDYMLVHCISADFALGAGIAKQFRKYGVKDALIRAEAHGTTHSRGFFDGKGYCSFVNIEECPWIVANLVTKARYFEKPTYKTIKDAIHDFKTGLLTCYPKVKKVGMPLIGCGLDGLAWANVSEIVRQQFEDTDIEIVVCRL